MLPADEARIRTFRVVPSLPESLNPLLSIANNLWWTWTPDAIALFVRLDPELWSRYGHNPVKLLGSVSQDRLEQAARDESFLHEIYRVHSRLDQHLSRQSWFANSFPDCQDASVAYFSAEFGLTECFQIYAGGLGVLAGDHLKSASELGVPLVGIGLLYQHGYFMQYLNADGWQQETYPDLDIANQPVVRVRDSEGRWRKITIELSGREVRAGIWVVRVGRIHLYLLDTNLPENDYEDRQITRNLYGGDVETRIQQEILLGIGGVRALTAMGIEPTVCHINEGHAAFLALERIRLLIEKHDTTFEEARQLAASSHVFTTHTPVPAGIDRFHPGLMESYFSDYVPHLRIDLNYLLGLGRDHPDNGDEFFSMAVLAIKTSDARNGVSRLHGEISRRMWRNVWPGVPEEEVPISHVTNGTHSRSWLSRDMSTLFNRYLGYRWQNDPTDHTVWERINDIPDEELWAVRNQRRRQLTTWSRRKIRAQCEARGCSSEEIEQATAALDPNALTVGFARRFATYKRGTLLLADMDRLLRLLGNADRPIQFLISGKSHPADASGKEVIRELLHFSRSGAAQGLSRRVVFLENYDMDVARYLVTGCDVWLNTPRRGMEASGTSGMKASVNGVINCSILDGWWDEAYRPDIGFAIGGREHYNSDAEADAIESASLYDLLEGHILPEFYERDAVGVPRLWIKRIKRSIQHLAPYFNTNRMVQEYAERMYVPAHRRQRQLEADDLAEARGLAQQVARYYTGWHQVRIDSVQADILHPLPVRQFLPIEAVITLGEFDPGEVSVQVYAGRILAEGDLVDGQALAMQHVEDLGDGRHKYTGQLSAEHSGQRGFAVRVIPSDSRLPETMLPGLITWEAPTGSKTNDPTPTATNADPEMVTASGG